MLILTVRNRSDKQDFIRPEAGVQRIRDRGAEVNERLHSEANRSGASNATVNAGLCVCLSAQTLRKSLARASSEVNRCNVISYIKDIVMIHTELLPGVCL